MGDNVGHAAAQRKYLTSLGRYGSASRIGAF